MTTAEMEELKRFIVKTVNEAIWKTVNEAIATVTLTDGNSAMFSGPVTGFKIPDKEEPKPPRGGFF